MIGRVLTTLAGAASIVTSACAPSAQPLVGFEDIAWVAALNRDVTGAITGASEVRALDGPLDLFSSADPLLVIVGWPDAAFGPTQPDPAIPLSVRADCAPRLPPPTRAIVLGDDGTSEVFEPALLPPLSADWADTLCPARDPTTYAFRADCREARSVAAVSRTAACTFSLTVEDIALAARIDPDGDLCLTTASSGGPTCTQTTPRNLASGTLACQLPEACAIDVYTPPATPPLTARRVALLDVPPFIPDTSLTGMQPQLPPFGQYVGYTHDFTVLGDRIIASTSTGAARILCGSDGAPSVLHALDVGDLALVATQAAPPCLNLLTTTGTTVVGLHVDGPGFGLVRIGPDLRTIIHRPLDDRVEPIPDGAPPRARAGCERPIDILAGGDRLFVIMERLPHCTSPGTTVHVLDGRTLAVIERRALEPVTPWRALIDGSHLLLAHATDRAVWVYDLATLALIERRVVPPDLTRNDTIISDVAVDGDALLVSTTRNQPALRRSHAGTDFDDRGFFIAHEADPVAIVPAFSGTRGLVLGTRDGDPRRWPTEAALYDPVTLTVLPGSIEIGHGPPRRVRADGRGGVLVLLPWEAALVSIRP